MSKKKSGRANNTGRTSGGQQQQKAVPSVITEEVVVDSKTQEEFEKNKSTLVEQFKKEMAELQSQINSFAEEQKKAEENTKKIKDEQVDADKRLRETLKKLDEKKRELDSSQKQGEDIIADAKAKAEEIRKAVDTEKIEILEEASEKAKKIWQEKIDNLEKQLNELAQKEVEIENKKRKLHEEIDDFEFEKEDFNQFKEFVNKQKEKYSQANPDRLNSLELEIQSQEEKYQNLLAKFQKNSTYIAELQATLDSITAEVSDASGKSFTASKLLEELQRIKEEYENLKSICARYPDEASIERLEEKARKSENLENENNSLKDERDNYRAQVAAAENDKRELSIIKREVEATNALNEHLLKELESHKTALESRTGDTCPALTKVDSEVEEEGFVSEVQRIKGTKYLESLQEIVEHVRNFAGSRKRAERLYYTANDIRAFLAGMAVSRLLILQGMSGTGKSSLPRVFSEAILGFNKLIPVESSWRDRNELLGYYNDFNKKFNAKIFTIELYRSSKNRCQEIPTFIVLDEMNIARIEYYFSDFLAILQEPDHNKWLIELVSSDMRTLPMELPEEIKQDMKLAHRDIYDIWEKIENSRKGNLQSECSDEEKEALSSYLAKLSQLTGAKDLIDGRKIRVTDNIWFVGTANQDESTFEISDKVYDRAQVVSLNKKGIAEGTYKDPTSKSISVSALTELFNNAIAGFKYAKEVEERLQRIDDVLMEKFDVSFGNRIVTQTVDFAAVFTAAGGKLEDALDYQISTKILRKVISSDDLEAFLELEDKTQGYKETQRLITKRIKELK